MAIASHHTDWHFLARASALGLLLGAACAAASLTPSMIPRGALVQGALSGLCFAAGYGIGAGLKGAWAWLGLPLPAPPTRQRLLLAAALLGLLILTAALWQAAAWQNSIRAVMDLPEVETARPFTIAAVGAALAVLLLAIGRLFRLMTRAVAVRLGRFVPPRVALILGLASAAALFWSVGNGVLLRGALEALDATYREVDALIDADGSPPADPLKTGSPASLIDWQGIGREGRETVSAAPTQAEITALTGRPALEPLRVYVGLNSAETPRERARLALDELLRIGAFERAALVIATPTGTGWVDPAWRASAEYLHHGDIAMVSVQYSYLPSWLTLMVDTGYGAETARAVISAVYGHWRTLPRESRPRLYLFGLSLGSVNADAALDLYDVIGDPFDGALWSGPPFANASWRQITADRIPESPAWLPRYRDGSVVRFTTQHGAPDLPGDAWGPLRIVYLQHASDPISFFEPSSLWRRPAWMEPPRGPDVSPAFRWVPVVTFLQMLFDMMTATTTPPGYGHVFAASDYIDAWAEVAAPEGWDPDAIDRLRARLAAQGL